MRARTEHLREALIDLERFSLADKESFFIERDWVAEMPIGRSEPLTNQKFSKHALRYFEFGIGTAKLAIFRYDTAENAIWILQCRPARPKRPPKRAGA